MKMKMMCPAHLGLLLLALHLLSSQVVQAQISTTAPMNMTMTTTMNMNGTSKPTMTAATSMNTTINGSGRMDSFTLLLPLALAASVLHGWSQ